MIKVNSKETPFTPIILRVDTKEDLNRFVNGLDGYLSHVANNESATYRLMNTLRNDLEKYCE